MSNIQSLKGKINPKDVKYKTSAPQMVSWIRDNVLHWKQVSGKFKLRLIDILSLNAKKMLY